MNGDAMDVVKPRYIDHWSEEELAKAIAEESVKAKAVLVEFLIGRGVSEEVATKEYSVQTRISNKGKESTTPKFTNQFYSKTHHLNIAEGQFSSKR